MIRKRLVLLIAICSIFVGAAVVFMPKGGHRPRLDDASARPEIETESVPQTEQHPEQMAAAESLVGEPKVLLTAATPNESTLYWIDDKGMYFCVDAKTGVLVHRARTPGISSGDRPVYASPIVINGQIYAQTRTSGLYVIAPSDELKVVAQNKFESDDSLFNATPAVDSGQLYLRSYKYLYCIGTKPDA